MVVRQRRTETEVHVWLSKWASCYHTKDWPVKKVTKVWVGHVTTISGLSLLTTLKSFTNWGADGHFEMHIMSKSQLDQKLQHKSQLFLTTVFFNFGRKKMQIYVFLNGHFLTISGHFFASYINIFHITEVQTIILRCLVCLNYNYIKSYDILLVKMLMFSCLKMHHFRGKIPQ